MRSSVGTRSNKISSKTICYEGVDAEKTARIIPLSLDRDGSERAPKESRECRQKLVDTKENGDTISLL
jgi:hypothetical protein